MNWEFWYCSSIRPFAIPSINSTLKQKTANYSATHQQHDNKATYKQICKSYSQLTNTLSLLGDTANRKRRRYSLWNDCPAILPVSVSLFISHSFLVLCLLLSLLAYLTCNQACRLMHTVVFSFSVPLFLSVCLSVCPVGSTPNRRRVRI